MSPDTEVRAARELNEAFDEIAALTAERDRLVRSLERSQRRVRELEAEMDMPMHGGQR